MQRRMFTLFAISLAMIVLATHLTLLLTAHNWNLSSLVLAGQPAADASVLPPGFRVLPDSNGYDGQFYYRLSIEPFSNQKNAHGITFESPVYRASRIGYPLLVHVLTGGNPAWVPIGMLVVNILVTIMIAVLGIRIANRNGHDSWWGLLFAFLPTVLFSLSRDTAEIVLLASLLGAVTSIREKHYLLAVGFLCWAILTRESAILFATAWLLVNWLPLKQQRSVVGRWLSFAPILFYVGWQSILFSWWGDVPQRVGIAIHFVPPFQGYATVGASIISDLPNLLGSLYLLEFVLIALFAGLSLICVRLASDNIHEHLAFIFYLIFISCLSPSVLSSDWAFMRVLGEFFLMGTLIMFSFHKQWPLWIWGSIIVATTPLYIARIIISVE